MTLLVLVLAAAVSGPHHRAATVHIHVEPEVTFALPPAATSGSGATDSWAAEKVPLT